MREGGAWNIRAGEGALYEAGGAPEETDASVHSYLNALLLQPSNIGFIIVTSFEGVFVYTCLGYIHFAEGRFRYPIYILVQ